MKLVSYKANGQSGFGALKADRIVDLTGIAPDLKGFLAAGAKAREAADKALGSGKDVLALDRVELLPPIPNPGTVWCAGMNTHSHFDEAKVHMGLKEKPTKPVLFIRNTNTLVASGQDLEKPKLEPMFDYEGEIALVIGKRGRNIPAAEGLNYIAGYSCFNDASARMYQRSSPQITAGKNAYHSGGFGPCLATRDEVKEKELTMTCRVNGAELQKMHVSDLIFGFAELVSFISEFTWVEPGDVIVTGSPVGVGALRKPPVLLKKGDKVEVEVSGIGTLVNGVRDQP